MSRNNRSGGGQRTPENQSPIPTPEQPPATPARPAAPTTPTPPPPLPPQPDSSPFFRNVVNPDEQTTTVPRVPSQNLEREKNYSKNEEIKSLVQRVRNREWENSERQKYLEQKYGRGVLRGIKEFLGGERDLAYQNGTIVYRPGVEILRRGVALGINAAEMAAATAALGLVTGGVGAIVAPAFIGGVLGRGFAEAWQGLAGNERGMREKILIARERYYSKAIEIADRISFEDFDQIPEPEQRSARIIANNNAIRDLVNFVKASEQHGVVFEENAQGQYYTNAQSFGQPIPPTGNPGDPMPGGPAGPALNTGVEVYQPSDFAPNGEKIDQLEEDFEKFKKKWEWIKIGMSLLGSAVGGAYSFLKASREITQQLSTQQGAFLDIDKNGIYHWVRTANEGMKRAWDITSNYVFSYNNMAEAGRAVAGGATALPGTVIGQAGTFFHTLAGGAGAVSSAISEAAFRSILPAAGTAIGGIIVHATARAIDVKMRMNNWNTKRNLMKQNQEIERRRLQPETTKQLLTNEARRMRKPLPQVSQEWIRTVGDENGGQYAQRMQILNIDGGDYSDALVEVKIFTEGDSVVEMVPLADFIYGNYTKIIRRQPNDFRPTPRPDGGQPVVEPTAPEEFSPIPQRPEVSVGQTINITIINVFENNRYLVNFDGQEIQIDLYEDAEPGDNLNVEVEELEDGGVVRVKKVGPLPKEPEIDFEKNKEKFDKMFDKGAKWIVKSGAPVGDVEGISVGDTCEISGVKKDGDGKIRVEFSAGGKEFNLSVDKFIRDLRPDFSDQMVDDLAENRNERIREFNDLVKAWTEENIGKIAVENVSSVDKIGIELEKVRGKLESTLQRGTEWIPRRDEPKIVGIDRTAMEEKRHEITLNKDAKFEIFGIAKDKNGSYEIRFIQDNGIERRKYAATLASFLGNFTPAFGKEIDQDIPGIRYKFQEMVRDWIKENKDKYLMLDQIIRDEPAKTPSDTEPTEPEKITIDDITEADKLEFAEYIKPGEVWKRESVGNFLGQRIFNGKFVDSRLSDLIKTGSEISLVTGAETETPVFYDSPADRIFVQFNADGRRYRAEIKTFFDNFRPNLFGEDKSRIKKFELWLKSEAQKLRDNPAPTVATVEEPIKEPEVVEPKIEQSRIERPEIPTRPRTVITPKSPKSIEESRPDGQKVDNKQENWDSAEGNKIRKGPLKDINVVDDGRTLDEAKAAVEARQLGNIQQIPQDKPLKKVELPVAAGAITNPEKLPENTSLRVRRDAVTSDIEVVQNGEEVSIEDVLSVYRNAKFAFIGADQTGAGSYIVEAKTPDGRATEFSIISDDLSQVFEISNVPETPAATNNETPGEILTAETVERAGEIDLGDGIKIAEGEIWGRKEADGEKMTISEIEPDGDELTIIFRDSDNKETIETMDKPSWNAAFRRMEKVEAIGGENA